jgi:hypothetical protein
MAIVSMVMFKQPVWLIYQLPVCNLFIPVCFITQMYTAHGYSQGTNKIGEGFNYIEINI